MHRVQSGQNSRISTTKINTLHHGTTLQRRVGVGEKRWKCPKTLSFWEAWLQIGCKKVLSICYQNDLNICNVNAADFSAAFFI